MAPKPIAKPRPAVKLVVRKSKSGTSYKDLVAKHDAAHCELLEEYGILVVKADQEAKAAKEAAAASNKRALAAEAELRRILEQRRHFKATVCKRCRAKLEP